VDRHRSVFVTSLLPDTRLGAGWRRYLRLLGEAALFTGLGMLFAQAWGVREGGIISIFLASAALRGRFNELLEEYNTGALLRQATGWQLYRRTALSVLALFLGIMLAYVVAGLLLGPARSTRLFHFALRVARVGDDTILTRSVPDLLALWRHNGVVLASVFALSFVYRSYAAVLTMAWNACVWGLVLTFLVLQGGARLGPQASPLTLLLAGLATLPHLVLEAAAYVLAALGAISLSESVVARSGERRLREQLAAPALLVAVSLLLIVVAGVVETLSFAAVRCALLPS
jgi:uncharacterized membrane protein SpoIIM required for sporulation